MNEHRFWIILSYRYKMPISVLRRLISSRMFAELLAFETCEGLDATKG